MVGYTKLNIRYNRLNLSRKISCNSDISAKLTTSQIAASSQELLSRVHTQVLFHIRQRH